MVKFCDMNGRWSLLLFFVISFRVIASCQPSRPLHDARPMDGKAIKAMILKKHKLT